MNGLIQVAQKSAKLLNQPPRRASILSLENFGWRRSSLESTTSEEDYEDPPSDCSSRRESIPIQEVDEDDIDDQDYQITKEEHRINQIVSARNASPVSLKSALELFREQRVDWDPDYLFAEFRHVMRLALNQRLDEALAVCDANLHKNMLYPFAKGYVLTVLAASSLDKDLIAQAMESLKLAADLAQEVRAKKSWAKSFFVKPNYNRLTDEECMAECIYALALVGVGAMMAISDRSYSSIIQAALYLNRSFGAYAEALNIMRHRKRWENEKCRKQFESGVKMGVGVLNLVFSFAPKKLVKVLSMVGFPADLQKALVDLHVVADFSDSFTYVIGVITLLVFYGFMEPVYGLGEIRNDTIKSLVKNFIGTNTFGGMNYVLKGVEETLSGRLREGIDNQNIAIKELSYFGNVSISCHIINMLNYSLICDWKNATRSMKVLMDTEVKNYVPSFLIYIYTSCLRHQMDDENRPELEAEIRSMLKQVKSQKGFFLLKRAFYERMVTERSVQFSGNVKNWLLPAFEVLYLGNFYCPLAGKAEYLQPILERIQEKLDALTRNDVDYWEKYAYLMFFKGVMTRLLKKESEALSIFHEVMSLETIIEKEKHVLPQSCYEIGLIHRGLGNTGEARRWFIKVAKYNNYFSEKLMSFRCKYALNEKKDEICNEMFDF